METDYGAELSLGDLFHLFRRGFIPTLTAALTLAVLTFLVSRQLAPEYGATTTLLASKPGSAQATFGVTLVTAPVVDTNVYQAAAKSQPVLENALLSLGEPEPSGEALAHFAKLVTVRVEAAPQSSLLRVTVRGPDPHWAAQAANALGNALLTWDTARAKQNLESIIATLEAQITAFDSEIAGASDGAGEDLTSLTVTQLEGLKALRTERTNQLNAVRALSTSAVGLLEVLEPAAPAAAPSRPTPKKNAALAFAVGFFLAYGLVLLKEALDTRYRSTEDVHLGTKVPVLGEFPALPAGITRLPVEASSFLRTNVMFATEQVLPKVIVITSPGPMEGKSAVALGLAESFARNDYKTLFIDADMRKPQASARLGLDAAGVGATTLRTYLESPKHVDAPPRVRIGNATLDVIPTLEAAPDPGELLSQSFSTLLDRFSPEYDAVIIDTPPVLPVADALTIARNATGVVLTVSLPTTERRALGAALDILERIGVRVLGTAITHLDDGAARFGRVNYGYGYGYGYGADETLTTRPRTISERLAALNDGACKRRET